MAVHVDRRPGNHDTQTLEERRRHDQVLAALDGATSVLDAESELLVQEELERLMRDRTSLVIAHRLSTVRDADRVVETGTHDELMRAGGVYARLVQHQLAPAGAEGVNATGS